MKSAGPSAEEDLSAGEKPWFTTDLQVLPEPEICFLVDCNVEKRISGRAEAFRSGKTSLCIDHHRETVSDSEYYYLDHDDRDGNMDIVNSYWKNDRGRITGIGES